MVRVLAKNTSFSQWWEWSGKTLFPSGEKTENKKVVSWGMVPHLQLFPPLGNTLRILFSFFSPPKGGKKTGNGKKHPGGGCVDGAKSWVLGKWEFSSFRTHRSEKSQQLVYTLCRPRGRMELSLEREDEMNLRACSRMVKAHQSSVHCTQRERGLMKSCERAGLLFTSVLGSCWVRFPATPTNGMTGQATNGKGGGLEQRTGCHSHLTITQSQDKE